MNKKRTKNGFNPLLILPTVLLLLCAVMIVLPRAQAARTTEVTPEPVMATVYYITPAGTVTGASAESGSVVMLEDGPEIENYVFVGWKDSGGRMVNTPEVKLYEDTWYAAVYAVALTDTEHKPYFDCSEEGFVYPFRPVTRGEAAKILYSFLALDIRGEAAYKDVPKGSSCYKAVNALHQLGVIGGSRFYPESPVTLREMLEILSQFFPRSYGDCEFAFPAADDDDYELCRNAAMHGWIPCGSDVSIEPDKDLDRGDFALLMNKVVDRSCSSDTPADICGGLTDVPPGTERFYALLEAAIEHEFSFENGREVWHSANKNPIYTPGPLFIDMYLYYIDESGAALVNTEKNGITFGANGRCTSGDAVTDELVHELILRNYEDGMSSDELLEKIYYDIVNTYKYRKNDLYENGVELPSAELTKYILSEGVGNCYHFACAFYEAAKALGYRAEVFSGNVSSQGGGRAPHGWVEIEIDGEVYVCDPEMDFEIIYWQGGRPKQYMVPLEKAENGGYNYRKD